MRDRAIFDIAIDSKLRGCDVVKVRIGDVGAGGETRRRSTLVQKKTGRPVAFEIGDTSQASLTAWLIIRGGQPDDFLFPSRVGHSGHNSTQQYARLVHDWVAAIGLNPDLFGTHPLQRTKASLIYRRTGNLRALQILVGYTKIESTVHCLGVDIEDALSLSEGTDI